MSTKFIQGRKGAVAVASLLIMSTAGAANPEPVTAEVEFVDPITITENSALKFGMLDKNFPSTDTVTIGTNSAVTDTSGRVQGGTQAAANLTVLATASRAITILIDQVVSGAGYTLSNYTCDYNSAAATGACDGAGLSATSAASATLMIGAKITGTGTAAIGVANGSFDVTVTYQ